MLPQVTLSLCYRYQSPAETLRKNIVSRDELRKVPPSLSWQFLPWNLSLLRQSWSAQLLAVKGKIPDRDLSVLRQRIPVH